MRKEKSIATHTDSPTSGQYTRNATLGNMDKDNGNNNILPRGKAVCFEEEGRGIPIRQGALLFFLRFLLRR